MQHAYSAKTNEAEARERLRAFWSGSSLGRPALLLRVRQKDPNLSPAATPPLTLKERDWSIDYHCKMAEWQLTECAWLAESMPNVMLGMGSWLVTTQGLVGADWDYQSGSAWTRSIPDLWKQPLPRFNPKQRMAAFLSQTLRAVGRVAGRRGFVNMPAYLDPVMALGEMRGQDKLLHDFLDEPQRIHRWIDALTDVYIESYDHFYKVLLGMGYGETCSWLGATLEGKMEMVQCDLAVNISPAMFEEFALPALRRITDYLDRSLYHLDGTCQLRFLDLLRRCPNLTGIQWNPETTAKRPVYWIDAFKDIRKRGFCLYVWCNVDEGVEITRAFGPDGLMLGLHPGTNHSDAFDSMAEAEEAIRRIEKAC